MKRKPIFPRSGDQGYTKFVILSYIISALLVLSSSSTVWAQAARTGKIVFMSKRDGNAEIYAMNTDGSEQVNLTQHPAADYAPTWSPNGKQILFSSDRDGIFDLYLMDADGTNVQKDLKTTNIDGRQLGHPMANRLHTHKGIQERQLNNLDHDGYLIPT